MKLPAIVLFASVFAVGIGVASVSEPPIEWWLLCLVLSAGVGMVWRKNCEAVFAPYLVTSSLLLVAFALGGLRTEWYSSQFGVSSLESQVSSEISFTGVVAREPDVREHSQLLYVDYDNDMVLVSTDRYQTILYGDVVSVTGELSKPESFETELGRTFNYSGYLLARQVEYRVSFAAVSVIESGQGNFIVHQLLTTKAWFIEQVDRVIPEPAAGLGKGLLLGVQSALGDAVESDFRRTGIIHIVVLSGYNVMLVAAFMLFCLSFLLPLRWRLIAGVGAIVAFAITVGLSATVVRASIMAGLVLLAQFYGRRYDVLRALFFAGLIMLWLNPYLLLYDIGFQLSFMATLGLLLFVPEFESTMLEKHTWWVSMRGFLLATIATQIAVLPLLMYHIGEVSLIAVVVNLLVLPMVPLAMLLTFVAGLSASMLPPVAMLIGYVAWWSLSYILEVAHFFALLPFAAVTIPSISPAVVGMLYLVLGFAWYRIKIVGTVSLPEQFDWTIEEEDMVLVNQKGGGTLRVPPPQNDDLPIFFR